MFSRRRWPVIATVLGLTVGGLSGAATASASPTGGTSSDPRPAARHAAPIGPDTITFGDLSVGTSVTDQYADRGAVFSGDSPFITTDGSNPTSPVLSGSPRFFGDIAIQIVDRTTHAASTASGITFDVGYIDDPNSVQIDYFAAGGTQLGSVRANARGVNTIVIPANGIARLLVHAVLSEDHGFAIDNVTVGTNSVSTTVHRMVALGDSYSSGEGLVPDSAHPATYECGTDMRKQSYYENTTVGYLGFSGGSCDTSTKGAVPRDYWKRPLKTYENLCHRSTAAWPWLARGTLGVSSSNTYFAACSGATTANVGYLDSSSDIENKAQFPKSPANTAGGHTQEYGASAFAARSSVPVDFVTVGVGGNDEQFSSIVRNCLLIACGAFPFQAVQRDAVKRVADVVYPRVRTTLANIRAAFPSATVLTYGYPSVLDPNKQCAGNNGLDKSEMAWAEQTLLPALNQAIADAAASVGVTYMPIDGVTRGHEICSASPWINGLRLGNDKLGLIANESFHPNQSGHAAIGKYFTKYYTDQQGHLTFANRPAAPTIPVVGGPVDSVVGDLQAQPTAPAVCGATCLQPACSPTVCQLDVQLTGFSRDTAVGLSLDGGSVNLGSVRTDADGDVATRLAVPPAVGDGTHVLATKGTDAAGVQQVGIAQVVIQRVVLPRADPYPDLVAVRPQRLLDTRASAQIGYRGAKPAAGATVRFAVSGVAPAAVPANSRAVVMTVTAVAPESAGYVTAWPCGSPRPLASNLNLRPGVVVPNQVTVPVGADGTVCLFTTARSDLVADLSGYYPGTGFLRAGSPERLLDTRAGSGQVGYRGARPGPGRTVALQVAGAGRAKVPSSATAVVLNVTAVNAQGAGFVTVFPCGGTRPLASNLNLRVGVVSTNQVTVGLDAAGRVCLYTSGGSDLIADLAGFLTYESRFVTGPPARVLDTRGPHPTGYTGARPAAGATVRLTLPGRGMPAVPGTASAVVLTVTGVNASTGYVTVWPCGGPRPVASNLNLTAGAVSANQVTVGLGTAGSVCLYTSGGADLIADLAGYFPGGR